MAKPGNQSLNQNNQEQEEEPPPAEKDQVMTDSNAESNILLSCWWSRGPSGQVQEWEARPITTPNTRRSDSQSGASRWGKNSRNNRKSKT